MGHRRTGLRTPENYLKVWSPVSPPDWTRTSRHGPTSAGSMRNCRSAKRAGGSRDTCCSCSVRTCSRRSVPFMESRTRAPSLLLFEDDLVALCRYLLESELVVLTQTDVVNGRGV